MALFLDPCYRERTILTHQMSEHRFDGDAWRHRWDSLRLFTPAFHNGLQGLPFPAAWDPSPPRANRPPTD